MSRKALGLLSLIFVVWGSCVFADGVPQPWQMGMQEPVTPVAEMVNSFHNFLLIIILGLYQIS